MMFVLRVYFFRLIPLFLVTFFLAVSPAVAEDTSSSRSGNGILSQFSLSFLGNYGMSKWNTNAVIATIPPPEQISPIVPDITLEDLERGSGQLKKLGFGIGLRYDLPNTRFFLTNRFFYHPKGRTDKLDLSFKAIFQYYSSLGYFYEAQIHEYQIEVSERWKNQLLLGWNFFNNNGISLSLLGGANACQN